MRQNTDLLSENFWPTSEQCLLLQAALAQTVLAQAAWHTYCRLVDLQKIDAVSTTFLPLVFHRFKAAFSPELQVCKSLYCHTWSSNAIVFFELKKILSALDAIGVEICLLKGSAMIAGYYQNLALRVMGDIDILVRKQEVKKIIHALAPLGWVMNHPAELDRRLRGGFIEVSLTHTVTQARLDVHWFIFPDSTFDPVLRQYQHRRVAVAFEKFQIQTMMLAPEDLLIHTITHGLKYSPVPLIRWIADAVVILQRTPEFDWSYFLSQIDGLDIHWVMRRAFVYLQQHQFVNIPEAVMATLSLYTPSQAQLNAFAIRAHKPNKTYLIRRFWHLHKRQSSTQNFFILCLTVPASLKKLSGALQWHQLANILYRKVKRHFQ